MVTDIFFSILTMSAAGSILALLLLLLKPLTQKAFGPTWQYYIWLAVLIVMLLPIRIPLLTDIDFPSNYTASITSDTAVGQQAAETTTQTEQPLTEPQTEAVLANSNFPLPAAAQAINIKYIVGYVWLLGFILIMFIKIAKYTIFLRTIDKNSQSDESLPNCSYNLQIRRTSLLEAPILIGLFKPVLYLPQTELTNQDLHYIIRHELIHYKRHDLLYKWFTLLVCSLHWFNPLLYIISRQIDEDCEISCDYAATKNLNNREQTAYMNTILKLLLNAKKQKHSLTTQMAGSKKILQRRFTMIRSIKKTSKVISFLSVFIAVLLFSTTALAGGIIQNVVSDNYKITVYNANQPISFNNQPFVENGTLYLPLREMLNTSNISNNDISYQNGIVQFLVSSDTKIIYRGQEYDYWINRVNINSQYGYIGGHSAGSTENTEFLCNPVLKNGTTYVPYDVIIKLAQSSQNIFSDISVKVTDKSGNIPNLNGTKYINEDLNFSLILPLSWCGSYITKATDSTVTFLHKTTYEKYGDGYGMLFYIELIPGKATSAEVEGTAGNREIIMQTPLYTYILGKPTDVQFPFMTNEENGETQIYPEDADSAKQYNEMTPMIDSFIAKSIKPIVSISLEGSKT